MNCCFLIDLFIDFFFLFKALSRALKRMKEKKVHKVDNIDFYSLKIAGPLMEEALLQLVIHRVEEVCKELETTVGETLT